MSPPWMPLYIADYRKHTSHLGAAEHGAYLLLIMHYWAVGELPDDDRQLARIACMTEREWRRARPIIQRFFHSGWRHHRIDSELGKTAKVSEAYASRAKKAAGKRWSKHTSSNAPSNAPSSPSSNATGMLGDAEPHPHSSGALAPSLSESKDSASKRVENDPERELFERGKAVLGPDAGGLIAKVRKAKNGSIPLARAVIETASTKQNPREYVGAILRGAAEQEQENGRVRVAI